MHTLKQRLIRWLTNNPGFHASGDLQRMVQQKTSYTAQNVGRRLREAVNEGALEVTYKRNHAYYRAKTLLKTPYNALQTPSYLSGPALSEVLDNMEIYFNAI